MHRLADVPVVLGDVGAAGAEGARGALAVHAHGALRAVHHVHLPLGDVVGTRRRRAPRRAPPSSRRKTCSNAPRTSCSIICRLATGEVAGARHRGEVLAGLGRAERRAGELPVGQLDAGARRHARHPPSVVGADLVAEPARAGVDHHARPGRRPTPKALAAPLVAAPPPPPAPRGSGCPSRAAAPASRPRSRARRLTAAASAPGITPPSSVCARSSGVASPRLARKPTPSSASRSSSPS